MKTIVLLVLVLHVVPVLGQRADSLAVLTEVDSLLRVSNNMIEHQQFDEALQRVEAAEAMAIAALGKSHSVYSICLFNRGNIYYYMGHYAEAEKIWLQYKAILEQTPETQQSEYADILSSLGMIYWKTGEFEKAETFLNESKTIFETTEGNDLPGYAFTLNCLAILYRETGNYEKAEALSLESLRIKEKSTEKNDPYYAGSLVNLANLYAAMGNYEKSESYYLDAKRIFEAEPENTEHSFYANCLNNLAILYSNMGIFEKAEALHIKANAVWRIKLGENHPDYAGGLNNLASVYWEAGNFRLAEQYYLEANAIWAETYGKENPDYALSLNNLASVYRSLADYPKAESLYLETIAIWEKTVGKEHPYFGESLHNLGILYFLAGDSQKARQYCFQANEIFRKSWGKENAEYVESLYNLANLNWATNNSDDAVRCLSEASDIDKLLLVKATRHLSDHELYAYIKKFDTWLTLSLSYAETKDELPELCYDNALFYKGFLLQAANQIKRLAQINPIAAEKFNLLKSYHRLLAAEYTLPVSERDNSGIADLNEKINELEKDLARTLNGCDNAMRQVKWREIQGALTAGEAAVEFIHFRYHHNKQTDSTSYAALLVRPGDNKPKFIPLFEERSLDSLLFTSGERRADYVNHLYTLAERGAKPLDKQQKTLYDLLWKPLEKELTGVKTIYFSPSGLLHRLHLAAIPINLDSVLADRYQLIELGSTRQLVVPTTTQSAANDALLFGGIRYDSDSTAIVQANAALDSVSFTSRGELSFAYTDSTLRIGTWSELPFTDREVRSVAGSLKTAGIQVDTRLGYAATEETFKRIGQNITPSPRILHLATHGFFFPDPKTTSTRFETSSTLDAPVPVFKLSDHPMIRSGLILAGANHAWTTGKPIKEGMEDGILTAYEISQMNLSNTELVVLSACETGLGDIQGNEGVYGLQRAFKIAGAKYLIMSLWQVPDQETSIFMANFYKHWLEGKMTIPDAFRATQQEMRERFINPYQWAGFVLVE